MRFTKTAAAAAALALIGGVATAGGASAADPGGTGTADSSTGVLTVALGTDGKIMLVRAGVERGRATTDPDVNDVPEGFSQFSALKAAAPLNPVSAGVGVSTPIVEARQPGGAKEVSTPTVDLAQPADNLAVKSFVATGSISPANLTALADPATAASTASSGLSNVSVVAGLVKVGSVKSSLGTGSDGSAAHAERAVEIDNLDLVNLGSLLGLWGLDLTNLSVAQVSALLTQLGVPVSGLPAGSTLAAQVASLGSTIDTLKTTITSAAGGTDITALPAPVTGVLGGLPALPGGAPIVPVLTGGAPADVTALTATLNGVQSQLAGLEATALKALSGVSLLKVSNAKVGIVSKATDDAKTSVATATGTIGAFQVGTVALPGVDLGAAATTVSSALATASGAANQVLATVSPALANVISVKALDTTGTGVTSDGGVQKAVAQITGLSVTITPPSAAALTALQGTLGSVLDTSTAGAPKVVPQAGGIGAAIASAGGTVPVLANGYTTVANSSGGSTLVPLGMSLLKAFTIPSSVVPAAAQAGLLSQPSTITALSLSATSTFAPKVVVAAPAPAAPAPTATGELPRTGGDPALAAFGVLLGALSLGGFDLLRRARRAA